MTVKQDVNDSDSTTDKTKLNPSDEGKSPSPELEKRIENLRAEYERKKNEAIDELREEMREEMEDRLTELEAKGNPSKKDEREIVDIEAELRALDANPKTKVWDERIKRNSDAVSKRNLKELDYGMAVEWIEDVSEGLKSDDPLADPKKLERAIVAKLKDGRWSDRPLRVRVKKAWKEMSGERSASETAEAERKKGIQSSVESGLPPAERKQNDYVGLAKEGKMDSALDAIFEKQVSEQRALEGAKR